MEEIGGIKFYSFEETIDEQVGKIGTQRRDKLEKDVEEALHAYAIGQAVKSARLKQNLTQEELGERVGVKKARISKIEKGYGISFVTISRVFKALGVNSAYLDLGTCGKVTLW